MCIKFYMIIFLSLTFVDNNEAARVLAVFSTPSISHQVVFRPLTQALANHELEVVVVTPDPAFSKGQTPANFTEIDVHDVSYSFWRKKLVTIIKLGYKNELRRQLEIICDALHNVFDEQIKNENFKELIENKRDYFDLLLIEPCVRSSLSLSHVFKVPVIQVSSFGPFFGSSEIVGAPSHPLLYPIYTCQGIHKFTLWENVIESYNHYGLQSIFDDHEEIENDMIKRSLGEDVSKLNELKNNVDMLFLNIHPIWGGNQPVPPNVVYLWGLYQKPIKVLPEDLKSYLDASEKGVIYMSFGTNAIPSILPPEKIQMFTKVFSQLPYDVLWKWDKDVLPGRSKNIRIGKWFPQSDLLRHPKVKLFITQGGLQSTDEAMSAGVPLIGVPLFADQWYNVHKYVYHKIGERLDFDTFTEDQLRNAINKVIGDESYRRNIIKLGALMHDQPQPPLEHAVWWTEHVLRHGGARHLRAPAANMSWWQFLELELVFSLLIGVLVTISFSLSIFFRLYKYASGYFNRGH